MEKKLPILVEFNIDIDDWIAFQEFHLLNDKAIKKSKFISTISVPLALLLVFFIFPEEGEINYISIAIFLLASVLWILYISKRYVKSLVKRLKNKIEKGDNSSILGLRTMEFDKNFLSLTTDEMESKMKWTVIKQILENENYFFLYSSSLTAYIIPKQKIYNLKELEDFLNQEILNRV